MVVGWNPPDLDLQNGLIKYYNVSLTEQQTGNILWFTENTTQITVAGLHPYYYYAVQVAAVTIGVGPFSDAVTIQLLESGNSNKFTFHEDLNMISPFLCLSS